MFKMVIILDLNMFFFRIEKSSCEPELRLLPILLKSFKHYNKVQCNVTVIENIEYSIIQ